jgi:hypothetical protein
MGKYALIFLLFVVSPVMAHDFIFTWQDPTQRTDGTALNPETEISGYRMRCQGPQDVIRFIDREVTAPVEGNKRQYRWVDAVQTDGVYSCQMTAMDTKDLESAWSEVAEAPKFTRPPAPTDFRIGVPDPVSRTQLVYFYGQGVVETEMVVNPGSLVLAHLWHRVTPTSDAFVDGWNKAYQHSVYINSNNDRRGTALFWKVATNENLQIRASWPETREFHLVLEVFEGVSNWALSNITLADNGTGSNSLQTNEVSVSKPSLVIVSLGAREPFQNAEANRLKGVRTLSLGDGSTQYPMGAVLGYDFNVNKAHYEFTFSTNRVVSGVAIFNYENK